MRKDGTDSRRLVTAGTAFRVRPNPVRELEFHTYPAARPPAAFRADEDSRCCDGVSPSCLRSRCRASRADPPEADRRADRVLREEGPAGPGRALLLVPRREEAERRACGSTRRPGVKAGRDDGPVVVPGDPAKSRLIKSVKRAGRLPDAAEGRRCRAEAVAALTEWVKTGAAFPERSGD